MSSQYILSIDQGTTGSTVLVLSFGSDGLDIIGRHNHEHPQSYPKDGWVEHSLEKIWHSVAIACTKSIEQAHSNDKNFSATKIAGIGITNQRETLCAYDDSGAAVYPAIVWQCKRSLSICQNLKGTGVEQAVRDKSGLMIDPYFTATKLAWLVKNSPNIAAGIRANTVKFSTIDTYILYKLTAGSSYKTEPSNASRTMLYNLRDGEFDPELRDIFELPRDLNLPEVVDSVADFGTTKGLSFLPDGIPIRSMLGDQQAALAGQGCIERQSAKCTYGTGAFLLTNVGQSVPQPPEGVLATVAWSLEGRRTYALEGSCFIAGAAMQFLRDQFCFFKSNQQIEQMAAMAKAAPSIYFVAALSGLGAPYWQPDVKGAILGLTRGTTKAEIVRAGIESICLQVVDLVQVMELATNSKLTSLNVDGGAVSNGLLLQIQADLLGTNVKRPRYIETTALGAGLFAAYGAGLLSDLASISKLNPVEVGFKPRKENKLNSIKILRGWKKAVKATQVFAANDKND